jgi:hypothetical protein
LPHELDRTPVHLRHHVETDDLDGNEAEEQGRDAGPADVIRTDLRVTDLAEPVGKPAALPREGSGSDRYALIERRTDLHGGEDILIFSHDTLPRLP